MDAELQARLIDAQNKKHPGLDLSLLTAKERDHTEFADRLLHTPEGAVWRAIVNTQRQTSFEAIEHAVAVEVSRQADRLSLVIFDSLTSSKSSAFLATPTRHIRAGISFVPTEAQKGYSGCRIHALHNAIQMHKHRDLMNDLHARNLGTVSAGDWGWLLNDSNIQTRRGVEFLPAGFFKHVTSRKTFDKLPKKVQNDVKDNFEKHYVPVASAHETIEQSISIDLKRMRYAQSALQN